MQDVDGVGHVQALAQPTRTRRPRVYLQALRLVLRSECLHGIVRDWGRDRNLGQILVVGTVEAKLPVRLAPDPVALLVDRAVVPPTERYKVRERGGSSSGPVADVMALDEGEPAAREAAATVAMEQGAPHRRRNR